MGSIVAGSRPAIICGLFLFRVRPSTGHCDALRYRVTEDVVHIDKAPTESDDPFAIFTEWQAKRTKRRMGHDHILG